MLHFVLDTRNETKITNSVFKKKGTVFTSTPSEVFDGPGLQLLGNCKFLNY